MFFPLEEYECMDWNSFTFVVPSVSVGNVGQLSVDILISSFDMVNVGHFHDASFLPVVGNDPYSKNKSNLCTIMTASQVYFNPKLKIAALQQRSCPVKGKQNHFVNNLVDWLKLSKFKRIVVLTSSHSHERLDEQLTGSQFRYKVSENLKQCMTQLPHNLHLIELENRNSTEEIFLPGSGYAKSLYTKCCNNGIDCALLVKFCSEGDNAMDGHGLIMYFIEWLRVITNDASLEKDLKISVPSSWKLLFGNKADQILFR